MFNDPIDSKALLKLAEEIAAKAGLTRVQSADCRWLSYDIHEVTGHHVSETTLKRFFGFAVSRYQLSGFTKNALSKYLGHADWASYIARVTSSSGKEEHGQYWKDLRKNALRISRYTFQALTNRSGIPYEYTIHRAFAEDHIRHFLDSDYLATSFIAPGGYGKSILLTRLVEKLWLGCEAEFQDDIVWFVSGQTIGGLLNMGFDLDNWFMNQVGLIEHENIHEYFANSPRDIHGRLVMILDGFDEIMHKDEQIQAFFTKILDFVAANKGFKWIKIILSVRSYTWEYVAEQIDNSSYIRKHWYLGPTFSNSSLINVPLLSEPEIMEILANLFGKNFSTLDLNPEMIQQLSNPFYIQLLFHLRMISLEKRADHEHFTYFDLISEFIMVKIYQTRFSSEKVALIKRFLEHTDTGSQKDFVEKDLLVPEQGDLRKAYHELISFGVLVEENLSNIFSFRKVVYFNHTNLLEYFIAMELLTIHNRMISKELFLEVDARYANSRHKIPLIKWLIYYAVEGNQLDGIPSLVSINISAFEKEKIIVYLAELIRKKYLDTEERNEQSKKQVLSKKCLFANFIVAGFTSRAYERSLTIFFEASLNISEKICLSASIAYIGLLDLDSKKILDQIKVLKRLNSAECCDFPLDPADLLVFIYEYYTGGNPDRSIPTRVMETIHEHPDEFRKTESPYYRVTYNLIMVVLKILGSAEDTFLVLNLLTPDRRKAIFQIRRRPTLFFNFFQFAFSSINSGDVETAKRIASFFDFYRNHSNYHNFSTIYLYFNEVLNLKIALAENNVEKAKMSQKNVVQICSKGNLLFRILSERNFVLYYEEKGLKAERQKLMNELKEQIILNDFDLERLCGALGASGYQPVSDFRSN